MSAENKHLEEAMEFADEGGFTNESIMAPIPGVDVTILDREVEAEPSISEEI